MQRDVFAAIADPTRRDIIGMISSRPMNVNELSDLDFPTLTDAEKDLLNIISRSTAIDCSDFI